MVTVRIEPIALAQSKYLPINYGTNSIVDPAKMVHPDVAQASRRVSRIGDEEEGLKGA